MIRNARHHCGLRGDGSQSSKPMSHCMHEDSKSSSSTSQLGPCPRWRVQRLVPLAHRPLRLYRSPQRPLSALHLPLDACPHGRLTRCEPPKCGFRLVAYTCRMNEYCPVRVSSLQQVAPALGDMRSSRCQAIDRFHPRILLARQELVHPHHAGPPRDIAVLVVPSILSPALALAVCVPHRGRSRDHYRCRARGNPYGVRQGFSKGCGVRGSLRGRDERRGA